jgi:ketosteroid isomerase-like protein
MHDNPWDELIGVTSDWDRAMVENDAEAIGRYMADDWTILAQKEER